jgi:eukaryotic-like serine/threonine-protein kinase
VVDETSLVYAVMEPVDANLGEILVERRLTELETRQIATSLLAALEALHSNGFVHEHVEPENVLAVGEEIKLRSDCIRETLEGEEGLALKRKDVRDYATVLLQALTQQRTLEGATRYLPLPAPFEQIVRKGMSGEWGLAQIGAALYPVATPPLPIAPPVTVAEERIERPVTTPIAAAPSVTPPLVANRIRVPVDETSRGFGLRGIGYGVGTLVILLLGWYFVHSRTAGSGDAQGMPAPAAQGNTPAVEKSSAATSVVRSAPPVAANAAPPRAQKPSVESYGRWRVIAFTYDQEDKARQKAAAIAQEHPDLNPTVFTPNGHAPFLVTLGGQMSKQDAFAFSGKAKREGMPKDTYAQNYRGNGN